VLGLPPEPPIHHHHHRKKKLRLQVPAGESAYNLKYTGDEALYHGSAIIRQIAKLPKRVPTDHFQGHGSDMVLTDQAKVQLNYEVLGVPTVTETFLRNFGITLAYEVYLLTAWFYCGAVQERIFPSCSKAWPNSPVGYTSCQAAALLFWTFPLYCSMLTVVVFFWDFLRTELFYQLMGHNVLIDYQNVSFWQAPSVRSAFAWMFLGCSTYFLSGEFDFDRVKLTLPYWVPVLSFGLLFLTSWDTETHLMSLQTYVEKDFESAVHHLGSCVFLRDYLVREGITAQSEDIQASTYFRVPESSGEYIHSLVKAIEKLEFKDNKIMDRMKSTIASRAQTDTETVFESVSSSYWISEFIAKLRSVDEPRCVSLRRCFGCYRFLVVILICLNLYMLVDTVLQHLRYRGELDTGVSWLDSWLGIEHKVHESLAPSTPKLLFLARRTFGH
jgi:hypothetical protein